MRTIGRPLLLLAAAAALACGHAGRAERAARARDRDALSALWSYYRYTHVQGGRVVALDEGGVTTSEGQGYALLRAVWMDDRATFDEVWRWTRENLQVRGDRLLAWRWKDRVLDRNAATDADQDVALALVLASRRFGDARYLEAARPLLADLWEREVVRVGDRFYPTGGNWAPGERWPTIHVAYLAPYAYEVFASVDPDRPWRALVDASYAVLRFLFVEKGLALPPEKIWIDPRTGALLLARPGGEPAAFGYDAVPIYWRVALDARWFGRREQADLRARMLRFPAEAFREEGRLRDRFTTTGRPLSELDGLPHLASVQALAAVEDPLLARELRDRKLDALFDAALAGEPTPYYLHNWLWFGRALEAGVARRFDEPLRFLAALDWGPFHERFPWIAVGAALVLALPARRSAVARAALCAVAFGLSVRYLAWRAAHTLNFVEPLGPAFSIALLAAEAYALTTVVLLAVQTGFGRKPRRAPEARGSGSCPGAPGEGAPEPRREPAPGGVGSRPASLGGEGAPELPREHGIPSVDVLVPIYSEPLDILDRTLTACAALRWPRFTVWVCDDSHRAEVAALAAEHGARYLRGPKRHAKAGNLNAALGRLEGDLVAVFDTDHVPVAAFLERTVPCFGDPRVGFVQTPHHFMNPDVFQRALGAGPRVPNEADLFNHAIQGARDRWGGAFFVGSGAVFRREALAGIGGFQLLSITEDIHTSQKLHARGWRSRFVDADLAAGLSAETLASYVVQRRRWMLGCLQIFFRDNPLLQRGLPLRHRIGYLASLWFFFFPLARVVFFATPLLYLLFHLHPLFAELPLLLAYLLPHLVAVPLAARALVPGWPRTLWGSLYEAAVAFPLARAMLDLLLPKNLGFKVTPKGVRSDRRSFDLASSRLTLVAAGAGLAAILKGAVELAAFGIEVEAYAFNLFWATVNVVSLLAALLVAWERPQRRGDERVRRRLPVTLAAPRLALEAWTLDLSRTGAAVKLPAGAVLPAGVEVAFGSPEPLRLRARVVWRERVGRATRAGLAFDAPGVEAQRALVRLALSHDGALEDAHAGRHRWQVAMAAALLAGLWRAVMPLRARRRHADRRRTVRLLRWVGPAGGALAVALDASAGGLGVAGLGVPPGAGTLVPVIAAGGVSWGRVAHVRRVPGLGWRAGLAFADAPAGEAAPRWWLAA